jgi:predicted alpha/beta-hydrolase family hydrolase
MQSNIDQIVELGNPPVRGFLHHPTGKPSRGLVLTHGAGGNANSPLLVALANTFAEKGWAVLRCDLPFRQRRPQGPPRGSAAEDQVGLRRAAEVLSQRTGLTIFLGGQSYGGRQATILVAEDATIAEGLLVLSYPLHPPGKPEQLRTAHLSKIQKPALFVSGTKDPFGSPEELRAAIAHIAAKTSFLSVENSGHDLGFGRSARRQQDLPQRILRASEELFGAA